MARYECEVCGLIYDEALGLAEEQIPPGTRLEELPDDWVCPDCGAPRKAFVPVE
ncbi:MAG TPA: rubredoxin [Motiliproteus sp.]